MRSKHHKLFLWAGLLAVVALSSPTVILRGQTQTPAPTTVQPGGSGQGRVSVGADEEPESPMMHRAAAMALKKRNEQRQQQIVKDTERLADLAQQLKEEVAKTDKNTLSVAVIKKAEEIEKLAKSVKEKMKAE